ncbi:MAG: DUF2231 domain-containing protein [Elusimicrobia bacterium]|nr:DUF2231 domain-containing protein [Elusimicrobiota bacterium]
MELKLYHLHPAVVHFPIALLTLGAAVAGLRLRRNAPGWLMAAESWLLWLGTLSAWAALGAGALAEQSAPHVPLAWEVLAEHEELAWRTCAIFSALSGLRLFAVRAGRDAEKIRAAQVLLWMIGFGLLAATAMHGGELVYGFGAGVRAP